MNQTWTWTVTSTVTSTTRSTTTSSTTSTTTTTTTPLVEAVADAGPDVAVGLGGTVTLSARSLDAGTPEDRVRWRQSSGPDVLGGGADGPSVTFQAPESLAGAPAHNRRRL